MASAPTVSLRSRGLTPSLQRALVISLLIHLTIWGLWNLNEKFHLERFLPFQKLVASVRQVLLAMTPKAAPVVKKEEPMLVIEQPRTRDLGEFIQVDPRQVVKEVPKNAKYYSSVNTEASNPSIKVESQDANIDGRAKFERKLLENSPEKKKEDAPASLQPNTGAAEKTEEARPKPKFSAGDLALNKPAEKTDTGKKETEKGEAEQEKRSRPRKLAEVKGSPGEKARMEGGVKKLDLSASVAARGTVTGNYDWSIYEAIRDHWYDLIDQVGAPQGGKVVLDFCFHSDGRISDMHVAETAVGEMQTLLCEKAILDPAPFPKWPKEMLQELGSDRRNIRWTFTYGE